ncbi:ATPase inhibitor subunit zeta [Rhizobium sp. 18065]|uniref:ATPase inhibitor subunit zeta n=1 Tax=Rhizobium sp. 18065 TaxID=2681411 RepID=UPI001FCE7EE1|nr:ATPase inhibitor subunit zeta [Rhizobium sp. 18065]
MTIVTGDIKNTGDRSHSEQRAENHAENRAGHQEGEGLDGIRARRNLLAGYWAGSLIGFVGDDLGRYARDLHEVDHAVAGDSDVVARLSRDLSLAGHTFSKADIEAALRRFHVQALKDTGCTE